MTKVISSQTSNKKYFLTIENGVATDCTCGDRQHRHHECKHMRNFDVEVNKAATFLLLRERFDSRLNGDIETRRINFEMSLGY